MILEYLFQFHLQDCTNILSELDNLGYYSIEIDFMKLFETYPDVGDQVLCNPVESLPTCNNDIIKCQQTILESPEYKTLISQLRYTFLKRNVQARFFGLPVCPELHRTIFPKNVDMGCFLKVSGTVVRVTQTKMLEYQRKYVCMKCKFENCVEADFENRYILRAPSKCGNDDTRCKCSTFSQVNLVSREHCRDYQEIKIQEQVNKLSIGTIPGSMWVVLEDDLVDCCKPGDDVNICGTVRRRWRPSVQNKKCEVELVMQANYIEVSNAQRAEVIASAPDVKDCFNEFWSKFEACPLKGRDQILSSVCPQVYGLHLVKLAVILTVITGSNQTSDESNKEVKDDKYAMHVRGQCHLLLVGDPGTGKSQLLRAGAELTPRSVFTSGAGSTRAGLTCAALREDGEWQLEAGALVLSDGGVCCIDEISHLRERDRTAIHEAMEQQTISIAKAGIVCKLNTRCAVFAACNPKGHYRTDEPLAANVALGTPLLSSFELIVDSSSSSSSVSDGPQTHYSTDPTHPEDEPPMGSKLVGTDTIYTFDLIFILLDCKNKLWDESVSSYVLRGAARAQRSPTRWTIEKLQMYIGLVGPRNTDMTQSANAILQSYYMLQRKSPHRDPSRTTVRMLDSLVRLSQAHCRLMYRKIILPVDAIMAVSLVDLSMQDCTLNDTMNALHSTLQKYPDFDYLCTAKTLLERLNLNRIWKEELLRYAKSLQTDYKTLESHIERGCTKLFSKYDELTDENIPLSCSLITSTYFKKDVIPNNYNKKENGNTEKIIINDRLAATLRKHATLRKGDDKTLVTKKVIRKRKRKEVTADVSAVGVKNKPKFTKKKKNLSNNDTTAMLNAVPSVNDVFNDLDVLNNDNDSTVGTQDNVEKEHYCKSNKTDLNETNESTNAGSKCHSKTFNFLKQFEYTKKEGHNQSVEDFEDVVLLGTVKKETNVSVAKSLSKATSSSQISMFESTDCDIDLDV